MGLHVQIVLAQLNGSGCMGGIIPELAVDVDSGCCSDEGGAVEVAALPYSHEEVELIVDEDAAALQLLLLLDEGGVQIALEGGVDEIASDVGILSAHDSESYYLGIL